MKKNLVYLILIIILAAFFLAPLLAQENPVDHVSTQAGTVVKLRGEDHKLSAGSLNVGDNFLAIAHSSNLSFPFKNTVTLVSIVPALGTPVCTIQTKTLATNSNISSDVDLITISRDPPAKVKSFAEESGIDNESFVSDAASKDFGMQTGLLVEDRSVLARALMVLDEQGIVRYLQIVPEMSHLPDINKAIAFANELAASSQQ